MTRNTPRRTAEQWQNLVAEQRRSGLSMAAFCRREELVYQSFVSHARRVPLPSATDEHATAEPALPEFVEIGTAAAPGPASATAAAPSSPWLVELDLGEGLQLRIRRPS